MKRNSLLMRNDILKKTNASGANGEPPRHFPPGGKLRMTTGWQHSTGKMGFAIRADTKITCPNSAMGTSLYISTAGLFGILIQRSLSYLRPKSQRFSRMGDVWAT